MTEHFSNRERELIDGAGCLARIETLRETIRPGDRVKFNRDGRSVRAEIVAKYPYIVHAKDDDGISYGVQCFDLLTGGQRDL